MKKTALLSFLCIAGIGFGQDGSSWNQCIKRKKMVIVKFGKGNDIFGG